MWKAENLLTKHPQLNSWNFFCWGIADGMQEGKRPFLHWNLWIMYHFNKNYKSYYRSVWLQVCNKFWTIWSILTHFLFLSRSILVYLYLSWYILTYLGSSQSILVQLNLSWSILLHHDLSWAILSYLGHFRKKKPA